ncbi:MAG: hypothetical protein JSW71_02695 [Gemmatimonadota bacterium]|nr:MAG: hypothetical protein JSW71_02695 [Gemmatimonadota bacterium]
MKRTTLILDDAIFRAVRRLAEREGLHMSQVVNSLLGEGLQRRKGREADRHFELPTYRMGRPRVNLGDRNALEALMDS